MRADATGIHPDAVVVEFSGKPLTPRMKDLDGLSLIGAAHFQKYAADAQAVLNIFTPTHSIVFFAGAPISRTADRSGDISNAILHAMYAALAGYSPYGRYTDAVRRFYHKAAGPTPCPDCLKSLHRRAQRQRHPNQRRTRSRWRPLLPRSPRRRTWRDRPVPSMGQRRVAVRQCHGSTCRRPSDRRATAGPGSL
ncbi:MAG TPA: hypothetical protein VFZ97_04215 [Acidimicrobiales bacterium]